MTIGGMKFKQEPEDEATSNAEEAQTGELMPTTQESIKVMTVDDKRRALELRNFHRNLGHPSDSVLAAAIRAGAYAEKLFTARDVENALRLLGPCEACIEGNMIRPAEETNDDVLPPHIGHTWYIDLKRLPARTIGGNIELVIAKEAKTGYLKSKAIKSKGADDVFGGTMTI